MPRWTGMTGGGRGGTESDHSNIATSVAGSLKSEGRGTGRGRGRHDSEGKRTSADNGASSGGGNVESVLVVEKDEGVLSAGASFFAHDGFNARVATRDDEGFGVGHGSVRPLPLVPSDVMKEEEVVGCHEFAVFGWLRVLCDTIVE